MKKGKFLIILMVILLLPNFYLVNAEEEIEDEYEMEEILISTYDEYEDTYFNVDDDINFEAYDIKHNLFSIGKYIKTYGTIEGIHFALGNELNISSYDDYGVYFGNNVDINSTIFYDLFAVGNSINLSSESNINRDAYLAGNQVYINTNINGNLFVTATSLYLNNVTIFGNAYIAASEINFGENVTILGDLKYNDNVVTKGIENASLNIVKTYEISDDSEIIDEDEMPVQRFYSKIRSGISLSVVLIIIFSLFPKLYEKLPKEINEKISKYALSGLIALVCTPIAVILLMITVLGIPLALILLLLYILFIYLSFGISSIIVGKLILTKLLKKNSNMYLEILIGVFTVKLLTLIPVVASILNVVCLITGLGIIATLIIKKKI